MYSFVIPALNESGRIGALLEDIAVRFPDAERIVVDGGSRDDTVAEAMARAATVLVSEPGRAKQMNLGAEAATGAVLCFLHADTKPLFDEAQLRSALPKDFGWSFCRITLRGQARALRLVAWFINHRSRLTSIATGDQLLMVNRDLFFDLGTFPELKLMEDIELTSRLRRRQRAHPCDLNVESSGRRWEQQGVVATVVRMWALRFAYWMGVSPDRLWEHYYGKHALEHGAEFADQPQNLSPDRSQRSTPSIRRRERVEDNESGSAL
ncbi:MAG: TIGR04283 family arsenosugar biosynthesis glycosyltransferase [Pseudomonadota bacterium]